VGKTSPKTKNSGKRTPRTPADRGEIRIIGRQHLEPYILGGKIQ
jgi:hypothetical protein